MKTFQITYTDASDDACPAFTMRMRGYNAEHVVDKFYDSNDDGWKIVKIEIAKEAA